MRAHPIVTKRKYPPGPTSVRLTPGEKRALLRQARKENRSLGSLLRHIIASYISFEKLRTER